MIAAGQARPTQASSPTQEMGRDQSARLTGIIINDNIQRMWKVVSTDE